MLRGNLSTRPFYNERLVSAAIALVALLAIALTGFNGYTLYALSKQRSGLKARIERDTSQAEQIKRGAAALQRTVDPAILVHLAGSTQEANTLIDQRTFSWTVFFGVIEKTLPIDLRLVRVTPRVEKGNFLVTMSVIGKSLEDIDAFVDALQDTGSFDELSPKTEERNDEDNTYRADVIGYYLPPNQAAPTNRPTKPMKSIGKGQP